MQDNEQYEDKNNSHITENTSFILCKRYRQKYLCGEIRFKIWTYEKFKDTAKVTTKIKGCIRKCYKGEWTETEKIIPWWVCVNGDRNRR